MGEAKDKLEKKREQFRKDPDKFVNVDDLVFAVRRASKDDKTELQIWLDNKSPRQELFIAIGEIKDAINQLLTARKVQAYRERVEANKVAQYVGLKGIKNRILKH